MSLLHPMRGQPVRALAVVLVGWVLVRMATWQPPVAMTEFPAALVRQPGLCQIAPAAVWRFSPLPQHGGSVGTTGFAVAGPAPSGTGRIVLLAAGLAHPERTAALSPFAGGVDQPLAGLQAAPRAAPTLLPTAQFLRDPAARPWSMDAWALWREGSSAPLVAGQPSYGRSQIGVVLRYHLAPSSPHLPQAFVRVSAALEGPEERELAAGLSARPLADVPLRIAGEVRASESATDTHLRAAAFVVSELPPIALPLGATGEVYLQAGYVTGRNATGFVDGQARITRAVARRGDFRFSAGGGAWGGAQDGSRRLDIGPTAALAFRIGDASARLAADYRLRVAGDAAPASGPALTLSAGF